MLLCLLYSDHNAAPGACCTLDLCGAPGPFSPRVPWNHYLLLLENRLLRVLQDVWESKRDVEDLKGNWKQCANWLGISFLDEAMKVFTHVILEQLQAIAHTISPEFQSVFYKR